MPWSVSDVDKHKKGLSDKGKERWVAVANSVLKKCMDDGGDESTCAASAIRQANGVSGNEYHVYKSKQDISFTPVTKKHNGKDHIVVPVVMMVEGVHNGSHGPLFHPIDELGKFPESWNGIPVVIYHPQKDGVNVSANSPDVIETAIGRVYNTYVKESKKLAAEIWLDEEKLKKISQEVLDQIKAGVSLEVSLGMFTEEELSTGDWNGEHYEAIARNHRPDHLALLPGSVGACSLADGCGLRANSEGTQENPEDSHESNLLIKKEVTEMSVNEKCTPCVKKKVDTLIANSQGKYTEEDRELLETLSEALLDKIASPTVVEKEVIKEVERVIEVNVLSDEDKEALATYKKQIKDKRDALVKTIQDNLGKDTWTDEVLGGMKDEVLEKVAGLIKKEEPVDYSIYGENPSLNVNDSKERPMPPTGIKFKSK